MQVAFLMIITTLGIIYAFVLKKAKIALGLIVLLVSLALQIPNLTHGFWVDVLGALSLIVFALAIFVMVFEKKTKSDKEGNVKEIKNDDEK